VRPFAEIDALEPRFLMAASVHNSLMFEVPPALSTRLTVSLKHGSGGVGAPSATSQKPGKNVALAAPSALIATIQGSGVQLAWKDNDSSAKGYYVLRSTDGGATFSRIATLTTSTASSYTDRAVVSGTTYAYEVQAFDGTRISAASNAATATLPTVAPTGLVATDAGAWVSLAWTGNDPAAAGYTVLRSADGVTFAQVAQLSSSSTCGYADTAVSPGQTYYYEVKAYYSSGATSPASNIASVIPTGAESGSGGDVTISTRYGNELVITASSANDVISLTQSDSLLTILAGGQSYTVSTPAWGVFIYTRCGNDSVSIASSVAVRTTVECIDGSSTIISSAGADVSAWIDAGDSFSGAGAVHRVSSFAGNVSKALGASLSNPTDAGTTMDVNLSLFASGPVAGDVNQGYVGDCYFLASLAAFANQKPSLITESAVDMGDGTFAVRFNNTYVRVSNQLSVGGYGGYAYAHPGANNTIWAMVMEKAFCYFRNGANSYSSIWSGLMSEAYSDFGVSSSNVFAGSYTETAFYNLMASDLAAGKAVTFATSSTAPDLVTSHAYTLVGAYTDASGATHYVVRNPWGMSGDALEDGGGYATLTFAQLKANFSMTTQALA
jgi:hypothetical protein